MSGDLLLLVSVSNDHEPILYTAQISRTGASTSDVVYYHTLDISFWGSFTPLPIIQSAYWQGFVILCYIKANILTVFEHLQGQRRISLIVTSNKNNFIIQLNEYLKRFIKIIRFPAETEVRASVWLLAEQQLLSAYE